MCRVDFWDQRKHVRLGSGDDRFLVLGGEVREWYEGFRNANWGRGTQDGNGYLLQRLTLHTDVHVAPRVRFFVQFTSGIEAGRNGGPRPVIDESKLFVEKGFVDLALSKADNDSMTLRLGRQEFRFGSGRFVDVREGPNIRQAFDGASLKWRTQSWSIDGFAAKPVRNGTAVFDAPPNHRTTFWGVYGVRPWQAVKGGNTDLYYLGLATNLIVVGRNNPHRRIGRQPTVGVRWNVNQHLSATASYGYFFVGPFLGHASPDNKNVAYASISTTYKF